MSARLRLAGCLEARRIAANIAKLPERRMNYPSKMLPTDTRPATRAHRSANVQVWVKIANHWRAVFASDDRNEAKRFANEQVRHGGAVEPLNCATWPARWSRSSRV
jgi:hypothetical protein